MSPREDMRSWEGQGPGPREGRLTEGIDRSHNRDSSGQQSAGLRTREGAVTDMKSKEDLAVKREEAIGWSGVDVTKGALDCAVGLRTKGGARRTRTAFRRRTGEDVVRTGPGVVAGEEAGAGVPPNSLCSGKGCEDGRRDC